MKYLFGPVNSRRLGLSQGIDIIPQGVCNYSCIYCEVSRKKQLTSQRLEYTPVQEITAEIDFIFSDKKRADAIDVFTITASGEPTLHSGISTIIKFIKKKTDKPVTVLTNGGLLHLSEVRDDLSNADIVVPSLDTACHSSFLKINRPIVNSDLSAIISGIAKFKQTFKGELWLEVLLVKGINDSFKDIKSLKKAINTIKPDKIQLNTVIRPPFESFSKPLTYDKLYEIALELGNKVEIIASFTKKEKIINKDISQYDIIEMLQRRPGTTEDICEALGGNVHQIEALLTQLAQEDKIFEQKHSENLFWLTKSK